MSLWAMKEVTKKIGVTESALRYYNAKGVLSPTKQETTGRRQWFYDNEAIYKLKKILLLKFLNVSIEDAGMAIIDDEMYRSMVITSLEEMRRERDKLDHKILVAETLAISFGVDLIKADEDIGDAEAMALNEMVREHLKEAAE